jgi:endonuclease/exonuclease/phosphatase (EEP) superfamily protein YafD
VFKFNRVKISIFLSLWACVSHTQATALDPTRPLGYEQVAGSSLNVSGQLQIKLNSILWSHDRKIAIINGQQLHENDTVKGVGAKIKKIEADAVTLQQGNKVWRVTLNKMVIRK